MKIDRWNMIGNIKKTIDQKKRNKKMTNGLHQLQKITQDFSIGYPKAQMYITD